MFFIKQCWHLVSECMNFWVWWVHWIIISVRPVYIVTTLSCFEVCGIWRFHSQEGCTWDQFCILPYKNKTSIWHCFISEFSMSFCNKKTNFSMSVTSGSYFGDIWITLWVSGSSGSTGVTYFRPCLSQWGYGTNLPCTYHSYPY